MSVVLVEWLNSLNCLSKPVTQISLELDFCNGCLLAELLDKAFSPRPVVEYIDERERLNRMDDGEPVPHYFVDDPSTNAKKQNYATLVPALANVGIVLSEVDVQRLMDAHRGSHLKLLGQIKKLYEERRLDLARYVVYLNEK
jgi:hypothetical protein